MDFEAANKVVHLVEDQWHYPIMTKHGYVADTKEGIGFVRSYNYTHPTTKHSVTVTTGCNSDYWKDNESGKGGFWGSLEPHLEALTSFEDVV